jgi:hypothetical protein
MIIKTRLYRKPDLLLLLAVFVGTGFLATSVTNAAEPGGVLTLDAKNDQTGHSESWWRSIWGLDLTRKLKDWHPKITVEEDAEGLNLARPFGKTGPGLQLSSSLPVSVQRSLRDGGDNGIGALGNDTDAYIFLQKRW